MEFQNDEINVLGTMAIGGASTMGHDLFQAPADLIKQRMQLCKNLSFTQTVKNVVNAEGPTGLFRSYPITVFMNIPYQAVVVCVNENLKTIIKPAERSNPHSWYFFCAGVAGGVAGIVTNPLDVVRTRLQTQTLAPSCTKLERQWAKSAAFNDGGKTQSGQAAMKE